jgi:hypothetical protein
MTIKGLTDRGSKFPEIGQIRKGGKKTDPKKPGPDLNYFRVEFDEGDTRAEQFEKLYGKEPKAIDIMFPFNEVERVWDAWFEGYTAGRMVARSDGEFFTYLVNVKTGEHMVQNGVDKDGKKVPHREIVGYYKSQDGKDMPIKMKPTGRLVVVIPDLHSLAYLTVHTTSIFDILNISGQIEAIRAMNNGVIAGVPLVMRRREKMISTPDLSDPSKRVRRKKSLISIEADPEWVKKMLLHVKHLALPGNGLNLLPEAIATPTEERIDDLPAGADNDDDETQEGEYTEAIDETGDEPETVDQSAEDDAPPADVQAAMDKMIGDKRLGDYSLDALTELVERKGTADTLKISARKVIGWMTR